MRLDFYKTEDDRWFIDLPEYIEQGGDHEDLEMVRGADQLLDILSNGSNAAQVEVSLTPKLNRVGFTYCDNLLLMHRFHAVQNAI